MEQKQLIIAVSRECGSGGHTIGKRLAEQFGLPFFDHNLLYEIAAEKQVDYKVLGKYDEVPRNRLFSRTVNGYSNSPEEVIANMQFDFLRKKAANGESFVVVGRCAENVLKGCDALVSVFILGDIENKIERVMMEEGITAEEAEKNIIFTDKKRKTYHNFYCKQKWGDTRNYDLSINSSRLGVDTTFEVIADYVHKRLALMSEK